MTAHEFVEPDPGMGDKGSRSITRSGNAAAGVRSSGKHLAVHDVDDVAVRDGLAILRKGVAISAQNWKIEVCIEVRVLPLAGFATADAEIVRISRRTRIRRVGGASRIAASGAGRVVEVNWIRINSYCDLISETGYGECLWTAELCVAAISLSKTDSFCRLRSAQSFVVVCD